MTAAAPAGGRLEAGAGGADFALDSGWRLHPGVALRPEPFGALLYHFHTRKLSFLKSPTIVAVVRSLADHPTARAACAAAGVAIDDPQVARLYMHALGQLARSRMIEPREPAATDSVPAEAEPVPAAESAIAPATDVAPAREGERR